MSVAKLGHVQKSFWTDRVLRDLSFTLERGSVYGFLGENASGKTTTLRLMMGLYRVDAGGVAVFDENPRDFQLQTKARVAYLPEDSEFLPKWMAPEDLAALNLACYPTWDAARFDDLLRRFDIKPKQKIGEMSKGKKRAAAIAVVLSTGAELLLLDEPASGLDPNARGKFLDALAETMIDGDKTILFSTHILSDVEKAADHIFILHNGRTALDENLDDLREKLYRVNASGPVAAADLPPDTWLIGAKSDLESGEFTLRTQSGELLRTHFRHLDPDARVSPFSLEDLFRKVTSVERTAS